MAVSGTSTPSPQDVLMARQPIYDCKSQLFGYELLCRNPQGLTDASIDGSKATSQVLVNLCASIDAQYDALQQPLFVSITDEFLLSDVFLPVNPEAVVLEFVQDTPVTEELLLSLAAMAKKGFRFALDSRQVGEIDIAVFPYLDYVKLDVSGGLASLETTVRDLARYPFELVAEKVESAEMYDACMQLGFNYFQGFYLARPAKVFGKKVNPSIQGLMQVMRRIQSSQSSMEDISEAVSREPRLVYQILRILNSPACKLHRKIESLPEALVLLGLNQLRKWTMMIMVTASGDEKTELVRILLTRARACELVAEGRRADNSDHFFMAGLLSGIDILLEADKDMLLQQISIATDIMDAVLYHRGPLGELLSDIQMIESQNWDGLNALPFERYEEIFEAYHQAGVWSHEMIALIYQ